MRELSRISKQLELVVGESKNSQARPSSSPTISNPPLDCANVRPKPCLEDHQLSQVKLSFNPLSPSPLSHLHTSILPINSKNRKDGRSSRNPLLRPCGRPLSLLVRIWFQNLSSPPNILPPFLPVLPIRRSSPPHSRPLSKPPNHISRPSRHGPLLSATKP